MNDINHIYHKNITLEQALLGGIFKIQLENGKTVKVKLKPGSFNGQIIRLKDLGQVSNGIHSDAYIELKVLNHPIYKVDGLDLRATFMITPTEALMGCSKIIPGPNGKHLMVDILPDSVDGQEIIFPNSGLADNQNSGDLIYTVKIDYLDELTKAIMKNQNNDPGSYLN